MYGSKRLQLRELAERRRRTDLRKYFGPDASSQYRHLGEFHEGVFECEHVSPWTISASDVDARCMVVGQDWSSSKTLEQSPPNRHVIDHGFDAKFITNGLLDLLLEKHLKTSRRDCYLTNLFPFIKVGKAGTSIPMPHLVRCAFDFLVPQIMAVRAQVVICLGLDTFNALLQAIDQPPAPNLSVAIEKTHEFNGSKLCAVAHTGAQGTKNRGMDQVHRDWQRIVGFAT